MTNKFHSSLQQVDEFEVASFESCEVFGAHCGIEVTWLDPRELGQVVHHLHVHDYIIIILYSRKFSLDKNFAQSSYLAVLQKY